MKHWQLLIIFMILVVGCNNDDPNPAQETITIEDELLGNWEFQKAELYKVGDASPSLTLERSKNCDKATDPVYWLIRQIDVRILTDKKYLSVIMTECLEGSDDYSHFILLSDYSLVVSDSSIQRGTGNPTYPFKWRIRSVSDTKLEMWRVAPDEATQSGVSGARMFYTFKKN